MTFPYSDNIATHSLQTQRSVLPFLALFTGLLLVAMVGCNNSRQATDERRVMSGSPPSLLHADDAYDDGIDPSMTRGLYDGVRPEQNRRDPQHASGHGPRAGTGRPTEPVWSVVLGTYSGEGHEDSARNMLQTLPQIDPRLRAARIERTRRGSMVVYGSYRSADDAHAQRDLEEIKEIEMRGRPVFGRAFLTRVAAGEGTRSPFALMNVREQYPDVDPLYTLQVAVWSDFGSGELSPQEIQRQAESYVRRLRTEGFPAFVLHDEQQKTSIVTVGLFNHTAIDPETGLMSRELRELRQRFPVHLVNGEEFQEPVDPRRPGRGTQPQRPPLVLVPTR